ncbi:phage tail spike protein [Collinsella aerofaciens]|uniref:phage tail spike protein n=1 Tax=Collinsella aerofaciens TaxID=74426 RepID=UPI00319E81B6
MRVDVYDRHDAYVGTIGPRQLLSMVHTDELNGSDELALRTTFPLHEGYRLVWADRLGTVHEHVCQKPKASRETGGVVWTDTALNSICELFGDFIFDKRPYGYGFLQALNVCLEPTRWKAGTVDQTGTVDAGLTFYHTSSREALQDILECGGELETQIVTDGTRVTDRLVGISAHRGRSGGHRRFSYGKDLTSIDRTEHWGAITACYGFGKGIETEGGGHGRKLTFGDINGGKDYVEDAAALKLYGRPDGKGGMAHVFGTFSDPDCEDVATLLAETRAYLDAHKEPGVTYSADVIDLVAMGRDWEGVAVGDDVQIVDTCFSPALRCGGRVTKLVTDELGGAMRVTLGNITETMTDMWLSQQKQVSSLSKRSSSWDVAASTPPSYLQQVVDAMNTQFNMSGSSYTFTSFEQGTIYASVPMDANGRSTTGKGSAMQLCSQGFRIASGCKADGSWDWRTFGTGAGFTADLITVGTLMGDLIKAGTIQDRSGKNYWNLDESEVHLGPGAKLDGKDIATTNAVVKSTVKLYAKNQSDTVPPLNMQNPELGWSEDIPQWANGYFIWSMERVTYGDGSVTHTAPVLEAAYNKAYQSAHDLTDSLDGLDTTVQDLARDGVVTEAEAAAVKKAKQDVDKEREELTSQYNALKSNKALSAQFLSSVLGPRYAKAFGTTDEGGTYGAYADKVDKVLQCKTAEELKASMYEYDAAYGAYSSAVKDYADAATGARHAIEQKDAADYADGILSAYDEQMDQKEMFDRLTKGGTEQGIYMQNDMVYINASYMATGTIADKLGRNSWNLTTGTLKTNYMTANNITANGTFKCGYTNWYTMLTSAGELAGYRTTNGSTPTKVGYIDYTASMRDTDTGAVYYGIQMQAQGSVRISSPIISTAATSDRNVTTTYGRTGSVSQPLVSEVHDNGDGTVGWHYGTFVINTINGLFTSYSTVGTTG